MKSIVKLLKNAFAPIVNGFNRLNIDEKVFFWAIILFSISYFTSVASLLIISVYTVYKKKNIFANPLYIPYIIFFGIALFSAILAKNVVGIVFTILGILPMLIVSLYAISFVRKNNIVFFLRTFVIFGIPAAIYGIWKFLYNYFVLYPQIADPNKLIFRLNSSYNNASIYAVLLMFFILIIFALLINQNEKRYRGYYIISLILYFAALSFTGTRAIWPALALGLFIQFLVLKKYKMVYAVTIACIIVLIILVINPHLIPRFSILDKNITQRITIWKSGISYLRENPILGQGMLSFWGRIWKGRYSHAHNIILTLWVEYGLFGMIAMIWAITKSIVTAVKLRLKNILSIEIALVLAYFGGVFVFGLTDNPILNFAIGFIFAFMMAVPFIVNKEIKDS